MKLKKTNVLVYGLGKSGLASINFLLMKKARVYVYDDLVKVDIENVIYIDESFDFSCLDYVVVSPGVYKGKIIERVKLLQIPIINELELASVFFKGKMIAITGTNGKTTSITLLGEIFKKAGISCVVCGNIGQPIVSFYDTDNKNSVYLIEVSSFQLEYAKSFKPYISCILNIGKDHLDRHETVENYERIKFSIAKNQTSKEYVVLNEALHKRSENYNLQAKKLFYMKYDCYLKEDMIFYKDTPVCNKKYIKLIGLKNLENVLACIVIAKIFNINNDVIVNALLAFKGLEHRIEIVGCRNGVEYINDSKATNVESTLCALESLKDRKLILLLGGSDKNEDFGNIFSHAENVKYIICFGQTKNSIYNCALNFGFKKIKKSCSLKKAFKMAVEIAKKNDTILLSPACASFDEFNGYEKRGRFFKELVYEIKD